jgi:hypothetical protein
LRIPIGGQLPFIGQTIVVTQPMVGGNPLLLETLHNLGEYVKEVHLINFTKGGNHTITHKQEYQIPFLPDYILDNHIQVSQIPPGFLKENKLILPKGQMFTLHRGKMYILLKGRLFIPHNLINHLILLRIHQVSLHS